MAKTNPSAARLISNEGEKVGSPKKWVTVTKDIAALRMRQPGRRPPIAMRMRYPVRKEFPPRADEKTAGNIAKQREGGPELHLLERLENLPGTGTQLLKQAVADCDWK
jgi:hypothetical protein